MLSILGKYSSNIIVHHREIYNLRLPYIYMSVGPIAYEFALFTSAINHISHQKLEKILTCPNMKKLCETIGVLCYPQDT
jgi:hypothetical protein